MYVRRGLPRDNISTMSTSAPTVAQARAAQELFDQLALTEGSSACAFRSGEFSDTELHVDDEASSEFEFFEDDGCLHAALGHFRLACYVGQYGTSERCSVQRRFERAARAVFAQHGDQFLALLA